MNSGADLNNRSIAPWSGFNATPLTELSDNSKMQLAYMLNRKKILHTDEGYERDWRGIAFLADVRNFVDDRVNNPMDAVLSSWIQNNPKTAKVGYLVKFLGIIDRWDIVDDIQENLKKDSDRYKLQQQRLEQQRVQLSVAQSCSPPGVDNNNNTLGRSLNILSLKDERCLRNGQPLPKYNAWVLYAKADEGHAEDIRKHLESPPYNLRLFLRHRDMLVGVQFEHVELSMLMTTRCNHLIIVLTNEFLKSRENIFFLNFKQMLQIENNQHKIIPILYNKVEIPPTLAMYTHLNLAQQSCPFNLWDKLARSVYDAPQAVN